MHAGIESAWHLEKVQVLNGKTGELVTFKCRAWLDATSEDGLIEREFYPMTDCSYKLELQVSPVLRWAGQQCSVLCCAVLCCAVLCCAVLCCAVLCYSPKAISVTDLLKPASVSQVSCCIGHQDLCCAELRLRFDAAMT